MWALPTPTSGSGAPRMRVHAHCAVGTLAVASVVVGAPTRRGHTACRSRRRSKVQGQGCRMRDSAGPAQTVLRKRRPVRTSRLSYRSTCGVPVVFLRVPPWRRAVPELKIGAAVDIHLLG